MSGFDLTQALSNFHCTWWGLRSITLKHVAPPTPPPSSPDPPLLNNVFLHLSVNLFTGGVFPIECWDTPPWADTTPPPILWDTVNNNKRAVRILLECILVFSHVPMFPPPLNQTSWINTWICVLIAILAMLTCIIYILNDRTNKENLW